MVVWSCCHFPRRVNPAEKAHACDCFHWSARYIYTAVYVARTATALPTFYIVLSFLSICTEIVDFSNIVVRRNSDVFKWYWCVCVLVFFGGGLVCCLIGFYIIRWLWFICSRLFPLAMSWNSTCDLYHIKTQISRIFFFHEICFSVTCHCFI